MINYKEIYITLVWNFDMQVGLFAESIYFDDKFEEVEIFDVVKLVFEVDNNFVVDMFVVGREDFVDYTEDN